MGIPSAVFPLHRPGGPYSQGELVVSPDVGRLTGVSASATRAFLTTFAKSGRGCLRILVGAALAAAAAAGPPSHPATVFFIPVPPLPSLLPPLLWKHGVPTLMDTRPFVGRGP